MGFKKLISTNNFREIASIFDKITHEAHSIPSTLKCSIGVTEETVIRTYVMSDSVILSVDIDAPKALLSIIKATAYIQTALIKRNPSVLSRGGIAMGEYYQEKDKAFGPALVKAYELESRKEGKGAKFPRVIFDDAISFDGVSECIACDDCDGEYFVDYLSVTLQDAYFQSFIRGDIDRKQAKTKDSSVKEKYNWYERYYELSMEKMKCHG